MDSTKEDDRLKELLESLDKYTSNTGAVSGAMGSDIDMSSTVYGGGYATDTITLSPSWNTTSISPMPSITIGSLPNVTVSGSNGTGYTFSNIAGAGITSAAGGLWNNNNSGQLNLTGEKADININGKSLVETLTALEARLNMLTPNPKLEAEWDELRELGERYRELEKQCEEKSKMWAKLKSMPPPTIT